MIHKRKGPRCRHGCKQGDGQAARCMYRYGAGAGVCLARGAGTTQEGSEREGTAARRGAAGAGRATAALLCIHGRRQCANAGSSRRRRRQLTTPPLACPQAIAAVRRRFGPADLPLLRVIRNGGRRLAAAGSFGHTPWAQAAGGAGGVGAAAPGLGAADVLFAPFECAELEARVVAQVGGGAWATCDKAYGAVACRAYGRK